MSVEPAMTPPQSVPAPSLKGLQPHRQGLVLGPVHDDEGEDELVPRLDESEDARGDQSVRRRKVTVRKARSRDEPSTMAASSSSFGTLATNPRSIQMVNGSTKAGTSASGRSQC